MEWPVSEKSFYKLVNSIYENYFNLLQKLNGQDYYTGIIETRFLNNLIQILHYNYVKNYAKKNKIKIGYTNLSEQFLSPNWEKIASFYNSYSYPYNRSQRIIRKLIKSVYFNRHLPLNKIILGVFLKKRNLSLGSFDNIKRDYIFKKKEFYYHIEWVDLINKRVKNIENTKLNEKINFISKELIKPILKTIKNSKFSKEFSKEINFDIIYKAWIMRIKDLYKIQLSLKPPKGIKELLITECGNPFHKAIAASYKSYNTTVINFSHGNDLGLIDQKWTQNYLFSTCDCYAFETDVIKSSFNKNRKNITLDFKEKVKYISVDSPKHNKIRDFPKYTKRTNNKIMLMGYPMNIKRYTDDVYCFFHYKLKLELHLLKELHKTKHNIAYKAHPDRILELGKIFKNETKEIIIKKFEEVWFEAEALIFTYVTTTTFGFALTCPIPIVLIESDNTPWLREKKEILQKRVAFISSYNETNYKKINYKKLSAAITQAKKKVNVNILDELIG